MSEPIRTAELREHIATWSYLDAEPALALLDVAEAANEVERTFKASAAAWQPKPRYPLSDTDAEAAHQADQRWSEARQRLRDALARLDFTAE